MPCLSSCFRGAFQHSHRVIEQTFLAENGRRAFSNIGLTRRPTRTRSSCQNARHRHADKSMDRVYAEELLSDAAWFQELVEKAGLGFDIPPSLLGLHGLQNKVIQAA